MANQRVTNALILKDICYLKKQQAETHTDVKEIKTILTSGSNKIASNRASIGAIWRVFGIVGTILSLIVAYATFK